MNPGMNRETVIQNAHLVLPDRMVANGVLRVSEGKIVAIQEINEDQAADSVPSIPRRVVDFSGDLVIPGLIDLHVHGCGGTDTMDAAPDTFDNMAAALLKQGTTSFLATTMTAGQQRLQAVLAAGKVFRSTCRQSELLGFHMEGPCISPAFRGAQKLMDLTEDSVFVTGEVKILTLAPEVPAAKKFMQRGKAVGAILSAGHSGASYEQMQAAVEAGISYVTHAFNAMPGIHHRMPGLLTAALLDPRVTIELIADGIHIHPAVLELALRLKGPDRVVLVSDGTRAVGMPDGEYELGGQQVCLHQGKMTLPDGTIAGSAASLLTGVRFLTKAAGRSLVEAARMAAFNPARLLRVEHRLGSLEAGKEATFLRLSPQTLALKEIWVQGQLV